MVMMFRWISKWNNLFVVYYCKLRVSKLELLKGYNWSWLGNVYGAAEHKNLYLTQKEHVELRLKHLFYQT